MKTIEKNLSIEGLAKYLGINEMVLYQETTSHICIYQKNDYDYVYVKETGELYRR